MSILTHRKSGVYAIVNKHNSKRYIGSSVDIEKRWKEHRSLLLRNKHKNIHLQRAWNTYGEKCFYVSVIEQCDISLLIQREQFYIDALRPEYNLAKFADAPMRGRTVSDRVKELLRKANLGNTRNRGRVHSEQSKQNMSLAHMGNTSRLGTSTSEQARKNISVGLKGKKRGPRSLEIRQKISNAQKGKVISDESRRRMSEAKKGKPSPKKGTTLSLEVRQKISQTLKGNIPWNKGKKKNVDR